MPQLRLSPALRSGLPLAAENARNMAGQFSAFLSRSPRLHLIVSVRYRTAIPRRARLPHSPHLISTVWVSTMILPGTGYVTGIKVNGRLRASPASMMPAARALGYANMACNFK
jgi:hypothetical protein